MKQYSRRDTIEVCGISADVPDDKIEEECLKIFNAAEVLVENRPPSGFFIHAAHRVGKNGKVLVKFVNRKFAYAAVSNSVKLKDSVYKGVYLRCTTQ